MLANTGDDILQFAALGCVVKHVISRQKRHTCSTRHTAELLQAAPVIPAIGHEAIEPNTLGGNSRQKLKNRQDLVGTRQELIVKSFARNLSQSLYFLCDGVVPAFFGKIDPRRDPPRMGRHHRQQQSFLPLQKIIEGKNAFALWRTELATAQQPAKAAVSGPVD